MGKRKKNDPFDGAAVIEVGCLRVWFADEMSALKWAKATLQTLTWNVVPDDGKKRCYDIKNDMKRVN